MSKVSIELSTLTNIGDAIREKKGTTEEIAVTELGNEIRGIQGGGEDTRFYELVEGTITEIDDAKITTISSNAFRNQKSLVKVDMPNLTKVGIYAFENCSALKTVNCPLLKTIDHSSFNKCSALESIDFPLVTSVSAYGFASCDNVETINLPLLTYIGNDNNLGSKVEHLVLPKLISLSSYSISRNQGFSLDLPVIAKIPSTAISSQNLRALILRNTEKIVTIVSNGLRLPYHIEGTVNSTYNPNGDKDGYIYVPRMFLSDDDETLDYRRATNWTVYAEQFRALEDWTVDGTVDGEMDWDRIKGGTT